MIIVGPFDNPVLWLTVASIPVLLYAWRCALRQDYRQALILLVIGGFLLRMGPALDPFLHTWDERYHALVAKHMLLHPFVPTLYENPVLPEAPLSWTEGRIWLHKPPFALWCMAASMKLLGINELAVRLPSLVVSTLGILLCFSFARNLYGRRVAFIAAFLYSIQGSVIEFASGRCATDHVDTMFAFLIGAGIVAYQTSLRRKRVLLILASGIFLGLAILTKWLPALIVLPVAAALSIAERRGSWRATVVDQAVLVIVATLVAGPWTVYTHTRFPEIAHYESLMNIAHFTTVLDGQGGSSLYYFDRLRIAYGELVYLPCIWYLIRSFMAHTNAGRYVVLIWWLVPYVIFSFAATKMAGYVLPSVIPVLTISALFWTVVERHIRSQRRYRWLGIVILVALIALPVRYSIERLKPFQDLSSMREARQGLVDRIGEEADRTVVFGCKEQYEAMFYTDCIAYERPLDAITKQWLERHGYRVITMPSDPGK